MIILEGCKERWKLYFAYCDSFNLQRLKPSQLHEARKLRDLEAYAAHMKECPACAARQPAPGYEVRTDEAIADSARLLLEAQAAA